MHPQQLGPNGGPNPQDEPDEGIMTNEEIYIRDRQKGRAHIPKNGNLRDQFAMAALTGILAYEYSTEERMVREIANFAYTCADEMLKRRRA